MDGVTEEKSDKDLIKCLLDSTKGDSKWKEFNAKYELDKSTKQGMFHFPLTWCLYLLTSSLMDTKLFPGFPHHTPPLDPNMLNESTSTSSFDLAYLPHRYWIHYLRKASILFLDC